VQSAEGIERQPMSLDAVALDRQLPFVQRVAVWEVYRPVAISLAAVVVRAIGGLTPAAYARQLTAMTNTPKVTAGL
jgi:hypothetical protein